jgi:peptide deformylase
MQDPVAISEDVQAVIVDTPNTAAPETLSINVHEEVKAIAVGIGNQAPPMINKTQLVEDGKKIMNDEIARYYEESMKYIQRYVPAHKKPSRWVTERDIDHVMSEGQVMLELCRIPHGTYGEANAIAHTQIDDKDPLRFFVTNSGLVMINPLILSHTKFSDTKKEGCMSYPAEPMTMVPRFNKVTVRYQMLIKNDDGKPDISKPQEITYNGKLAEVFQHETQHLNGVNIYDPFFTPESCAWFGDGKELTVEELDKLYETTTQGQGKVSEKDADKSGIGDKGEQVVSIASVVNKEGSNS